MFVTPKDGGLRHLNSYLEVNISFRNGWDSRIKEHTAARENFTGKTDLKDAYLTVPVCQCHQNFLNCLKRYDVVLEFHNQVQSPQLPSFISERGFRHKNLCRALCVQIVFLMIGGESSKRMIINF